LDHRAIAAAATQRHGVNRQLPHDLRSGPCLSRQQIAYRYVACEVRRRLSVVGVLHATGTVVSDCVFRVPLGTALTDDFPTKARRSRRLLRRCISCLLHWAFRAVPTGLGRDCCMSSTATPCPFAPYRAAGELGFKAEHARLDWWGCRRWVQSPILCSEKTPCHRRDRGGRDRSLGGCHLGSGRPIGKSLCAARGFRARGRPDTPVIITPPPSNGAGAPPSLDLCCNVRWARVLERHHPGQI